MKSKLISGALWVLLFFIGLIPKALVTPIANLFGRIAPFLLKRDSALIARNVQLVYKLPAHSNFTKSFQQQVFRSQVAIGLETLKNMLSKNRLLKVEGMDVLGHEVNRLLAAGKGLLVVTAHLGSWEMNATNVAVASGKRFHALAKPSKLPEFTGILEKLRGQTLTDVLWTNSKSILKDMIRVLKEGSTLGFVMDQKPEGRIGPVVNFFGQQTEFVSGPAKLSIRHRSPVLAIFCIRTGPWAYRIIFKTVAEPEHSESDEVAFTQRMAEAIEAAIRLYPEQWLWNYKRWRNQAVERS